MYFQDVDAPRAPTLAAQVQQRFHQNNFFTKEEAYKDFLIFLLRSLAFYKNYSKMPYLKGFLFQVPLVLFSPWGLQPSQASLRCFSGHGQPPQRHSAQPWILYWQQHSFTLHKVIHLIGFTMSYVSMCTQKDKKLHKSFCWRGFFFVKASFFCCPSALSQHIAQCFLYYKKSLYQAGRKKIFWGG